MKGTVLPGLHQGPGARDPRPDRRTRRSLRTGGRLSAISSGTAAAPRAASSFVVMIGLAERSASVFSSPSGPCLGEPDRSCRFAAWHVLASR